MLLILGTELATGLMDKRLNNAGATVYGSFGNFTWMSWNDAANYLLPEKIAFADALKIQGR
jgi:hypothetical protein